MPSYVRIRGTSSKRSRDVNSQGGSEPSETTDPPSRRSRPSRLQPGSQRSDVSTSSETPSKRPRSDQKEPWQVIAAKAKKHRDDTLDQVLPLLPKRGLSFTKNVTSIASTFLDEQFTAIYKTTLSPWLRDVNDTPLASINSVTDLSPDSLHRRLMDHEWPATAVTMAFLYSAGISQYLVNNLTELLPTRAMDRAQWLDGYYLEHGKPFGPLHGFPISVNDHFEFKGLWRSTDGYVCNWEHIAEEDNRILQALHNAGAVFHCRTTSPQTMMLLETQSNLYGITKNPYNTNHTSGGSCGGEGALVALRGSSIGIGTDSAGSIRCPAAFCGEYAFKPTGARIPPHECRCVHDNDDCVLGVISTHLSGVQLFMKTIVDSQPWPVSDRGNKSPEPEVVPWRDIEDLKTVLHNPAKLRIGVLWHDGVVTPQPPITRALRMLANELKRTSRKFTDPEIEIIDFSPYSHEEAWATIASLYFSGAKDTVRNSLKRSGEPELPITSNFLKYQHMFTGLMDNETLEDRKSWREDYKKEYAEHWEKYNIDVLLCPATPGIAPPHGEAHYYGYSTQWNCLDYPALVFPVTYVDKEVDVYPNEKLKPDTPNNMAIRNTFDPEEMHGMPVALQLVGRPLEDEKVLKVLEYITGSDGLNLWLPTTSF